MWLSYIIRGQLLLKNMAAITTTAREAKIGSSSLKVYYLKPLELGSKFQVILSKVLFLSSYIMVLDLL